MLDFFAHFARGRVIYVGGASITPEGKISFAGGNWVWFEPAPEDWRPMVYTNDPGLVTVEFYTYHQQYDKVFRYRDTNREGYSFTTEMDEIGDGGGGGWMY